MNTADNTTTAKTRPPVQPPVRVAVRASRYTPVDKARVRGRIVGCAFDETGNLWAYAVVDEAWPIVSPYGVSEHGQWPIEGDELVAVVQGWHIGPTYDGIRLTSGAPIFVYTQTVEDDRQEP